MKSTHTAKVFDGQLNVPEKEEQFETVLEKAGPREALREDQLYPDIDFSL